MKMYCVTFEKNEMIFCNEVNAPMDFDGDYHCQTSKDGDVLYALIKTDRKDAALEVSGLILNEMSGRRRI